jgi:hypothetical protein
MTATPPPPSTNWQVRKHPSSATVALIMGVLGLTLLPLVGPALALVFGYRSRREVAAQPEVYTDDLGRVGRILGWVGLALALAGALGVVVLFLLLA